MGISRNSPIKLKHSNILNELPAFKAHKLQNIAGARPVKQNDYSPTYKQKNHNEQRLKRRVTTKEDSSPRPENLSYSVETKREDGGNLYNIYSKPRRSRTQVRDHPRDDFGYGDTFQFADERLESPHSPVNNMPNKAGKNRYNLRPLAVHHVRSLHID